MGKAGARGQESGGSNATTSKQEGTQKSVKDGRVLGGVVVFHRRERTEETEGERGEDEEKEERRGEKRERETREQAIKYIINVNYYLQVNNKLWKTLSGR